MTIIYVKAYTREDGTYVRAHTREIDGSRKDESYYQSLRQSSNDLSEDIWKSIKDFNNINNEDIEMLSKGLLGNKEAFESYYSSIKNSSEESTDRMILSIDQLLEKSEKDFELLKTIKSKANAGKEIKPKNPVEVKGISAISIGEENSHKSVEDILFEEETGVKLNFKGIPKDINEYIKSAIRDAFNDYPRIRGRLSEVRIDRLPDDNFAMNEYDNETKTNIIYVRDDLNEKETFEKIKNSERDGTRPKGCLDYRCSIDHEIGHNLINSYKKEKNEFIDFIEKKEEKQPGYIMNNISGYAERGYNGDTFSSMSSEFAKKCEDPGYQFQMMCKKTKKKDRPKNLEEIFSEAYSMYMINKREKREDIIKNNEIMRKMDEVLNKMKNKKSFWDIF